MDDKKYIKDYLDRDIFEEDHHNRDERYKQIENRLSKIKSIIYR